jgi:hypothetical protein
LKRFYRVAHRLSNLQKQARIIMWKELLKLPEFMKYHSPRYRVALDKAWFYLSTDHESIWLSPEDEGWQRERTVVSSPKITLTIVCNPQGFHLIDVLPHGTKCNAGHHISHILSLLPKMLASYQDDRRRHFMIRADNARPVVPKRLVSFWITILYAEHLILLIPEIGAVKLLAFGCLKGMLQGSSFDGPDELLSAIQEILTEFDHVTLDAVFQNGWSDCKNVLMEIVNRLCDV